MVGLGQAKATNPFARGELGQVFLFLGFGAKLIDRHHHQRRLHAHHRAVTAVHAFNFARNQTISHIVQTGAAVFGGNGGAEQTEFTHFTKNFHIGFFVAKRIEHAWQQFVLAIRLRGFAHHAFVFGELLV